MPPIDQEDEFEYEYDQNETESFLLDLDLSSLNHVIKSRTPGFRRNLQRPLQRDGLSKPQNQSNARENSMDLDGDHDSEAATPASNATEQKTPADKQPVSGSGIQILDFHTRNPIISYHDHIYSCTWADMIGTNMFFSTHERRPMFEPQVSSDSYDLLGTSRIKLIGQKAKVTQKPGTAKRGRPVGDTARQWETSIDEDEILTTGKSLGNLRYNNAKVNADVKRQARFLEKFMDAKRTKGEKDNVRTVVTRQSVIATNKERKQTQNKLVGRAALHDEIEKLNRKVVRGDSAALIRLQEIYSLLEEAGDDEKNLPQASDAVSPRTKSHTQTPNAPQANPTRQLERNDAGG